MSDNEAPSQSTILEHHSPTLIAAFAGHRRQQRTQPAYRQLSKSILIRLTEDTGNLPFNTNPSSRPSQSAPETLNPDRYHPVPPSDLHQMTANAPATQCSVTPSHHTGAPLACRSDSPVNQQVSGVRQIRRKQNTSATHQLRILRIVYDIPSATLYTLNCFIGIPPE